MSVGGEVHELDAVQGHVPVLLYEAIESLRVTPGGRYVDGTFGGGGYSRAILATAGTAVVAFDRDPAAIEGGADLVRQATGRLRLVEAPFSTMAEAVEDLGLAPVTGVVLDVGVSSMQFDIARRGFSFRTDGPLDMRMAATGSTAADLVNGLDEVELADILYHYGEERLSRPIARAIVAARQDAPFTSTRALADVIRRVVRTRPGDIHPATRSFQALRIAVNDELGELVRALHAAEAILQPGGRLVVVSFHSLEDRIVKQFMAGRSGRMGGSRHAPVVESPATFRIEGKWPLVPSEAETWNNPRARSAKLRVAIRSEQPAQPTDPALMALAALPDRRKGRR